MNEKNNLEVSKRNVESLIMFFIFIVLIISLIVDLIIKFGYWNGLILINADMYGIIIGVATSISLLGTTMLSLALSRSEEYYLGINLSEYITSIYPKYFKMKNVIQMQLVLILFSVICWIFYLPSLLFSLFYISILLIWIMNENVFKFSLNSSEVKKHIENHIENKITNEHIPIDEKKDIIAKLEKYSLEITNSKKINELYTISDFYCRLVKSIPEGDNFIPIYSLISDSYSNVTIENFKSDDKRIMLNQFTHLSNIYSAYNEKNTETDIYRNVISYFYSSLKKIDFNIYSDYNINLSLIYDVLKINDTSNKDNKEYLNYFYANIYQSLYRKNFEYFETHVNEFFNPLSYTKIDPQDEKNIENLLRRMLILGDYDIFSTYFLKQLRDTAYYHYEYVEKKRITLKIISHLIYLNDISEFEDNEILTAKKFITENLFDIKNFLMCNSFEKTLLESDIFKNTNIINLKFEEGNGIIPKHDVQTFIWWLIANLSKQEKKQQIIEKYLNDNLVNLNPEKSPLVDHFEFFNNLFSIANKNSQEEIKKLAILSEAWHRKFYLTSNGINNSFIEKNIDISDIKKFSSNTLKESGKIKKSSFKKEYYTFLEKNAHLSLDHIINKFEESLKKEFFPIIIWDKIKMKFTSSHEISSHNNDEIPNKIKEIIEKKEKESFMLLMTNTTFKNFFQNNKLYFLSQNLDINIVVVSNEIEKNQNMALLIPINNIHFEVSNFSIKSIDSNLIYLIFLEKHKINDDENSANYELEFDQIGKLRFTKDEMQLLFKKYVLVLEAEINYNLLISLDSKIEKIIFK